MTSSCDLFELILCDTLAHSTCATDTTSDHLQHLIDIVSTTPFLMGNNINLVLDLWLLNKLAISTHALLRVRLGEGVADEGGGVQASKGNELPAVAELSETLDVSLLLGGGHGLLPIERGGKVVGQSIICVSDHPYI